jgi:hypothetical protein
VSALNVLADAVAMRRNAPSRKFGEDRSVIGR